MDLSASLASVTAKTCLQVICSRKTPHLVVLYQLRNHFGPEVITNIPAGNPSRTEEARNRLQSIDIPFELINIGSEQAENIKLLISGEFKCREPHTEWPISFSGMIIPQMAPGQSHFLFSINWWDLCEYSDGKQGERKTDTFTINISYEYNRGKINKLINLCYKLVRKQRFEYRFIFNPMSFGELLPPPTYSN